MIRLKTLFLVVMITGLSACDLRTTGPDFSEDGFSVHTRVGRLVLTNATPGPIHYFALEEETSALVDLYFDPEAWDSIAPGEEKRIPYGDLMGYAPGAKQARMYWWTNGEYRNSIVIELR